MSGAAARTGSLKKEKEDRENILKDIIVLLKTETQHSVQRQRNMPYRYRRQKIYRRRDTQYIKKYSYIKVGSTRKAVSKQHNGKGPMES